jgi:serine phosphatase RsbU (regulator of sigma subunit)
VALGLATLSSRSILHPIDQLVAIARRAAAGDNSPVRQHTDIPEIAVLEDALTDLLRQQQRLIKQTRDEARRERDVEIGAWIQDSVTPESLALPGLDLAAGTWRDPDASGDYYDLFEAGGELWLAIGDVAARGLRAGMLATLLHGSVRAAIEVDPEASPSAVLRALDPLFSRYLTTVGWSETFIALRLVRLSPDGTVRYAGAHEEMLLQRAGEQSTALHQWHGAWLGLGDDGLADDPDGELSLAPGDTLVLFTDGLLGAVDATGRYFGMAGLTKIIERSSGHPSRVVRDRLMTAWSEWVAAPGDDATVIVVRRRAGG